MPRLPSVCANGHTTPSGIELAPGVDVSIAAFSSECPVCGARSQIPDGVWYALNDAASVLTSPGTTVAELEALRELLQSGRPESEIAEEVEMTRFARLRRFLISPNAQAWARTLLRIVVSLISRGNDIAQIDPTSLVTDAIEDLDVVPAPPTAPPSGPLP